MRNVLLNRNTTQQVEGNVIIVYPTPNTMTTRTTLSLATTDDNFGYQQTAVQQQPQGSNNEEEVIAASSKGLKPKHRLGSMISSLSAYLNRLFSTTRRTTTNSKGQHDDTVVDTASCQQSTWWKRRRRLKLFNNTTTIRKKKNQKFLWCFRPVGTAAAFKSSSSWTEFEKKNQLELSRQLGLLSDNRGAQASFEIQDKHIFNNTVVITVMLKEGIAFVLDPEWSKPITYEITCRPKLNWYQEMRMRIEYQQWLKDQQQKERQ